MATRKNLIIYVVVIVCLLDSTALYVLAKYYMYIHVCAQDISIIWLVSSFHSICHHLITKHLELFSVKMSASLSVSAERAAPTI